MNFEWLPGYELPLNRANKYWVVGKNKRDV